MFSKAVSALYCITTAERLTKTKEDTLFTVMDYLYQGSSRLQEDFYIVMK